ncbi:hypothetical protein SARC_13754 [Sphaeroforma arctica JP610]|uniref:Uncharacterized protein n=1 Tax=Sphaeroforma arctica JP610 TaxID=667725 RepID=A0A0L0FAE9_9EUKA|nr:hypothetical protein SARC_13754 [Sphaeroforma arctica JP610]KNC73687.1 hypothetical protein SARC_13754 [Sphaeroforma arctica JP610]|eukprot:XP_014147589.1 hypothetical protein SARC_13754 [Sphaeroforma arctica JP610]
MWSIGLHLYYRTIYLQLMCPNRPYGRKPLHVKFRTRLFDANGYDVCACKFGSVYGMCKRRTKRYLNKVFPDRQKTGMKDWLYKYKAPDHEFFHTEYMNDTRTLELAKEWELQQDTAQAVYHDRAANHGRRKHDHQQ